MGCLWILCLGHASAGQSRIFTDLSGEQFEITKPFKRIISLYAAHSENLFDLGLDKEIIGVTPYEVYPPRALKKPVFSYKDDPEKIISARPDLVLIRPMIAKKYAEFVRNLKDAGISVISIQPVGIDDLYEYWRTLGVLIGREEKAEDMIQSFQKGIRNIRILAHTIPNTKRKRVYFEATHRKMRTFTPTSMQLFVLTMAGGINVSNDAEALQRSNIAAYGKHRVLSLADEIDVYLAQKGKMNRISAELIKNEPGFEHVKAVREDQVFIIEEHLVSRPTLRLAQGAVRIGGFLYPEIFTPEIWQGIVRIMSASGLPQYCQHSEG